MNTSIIAIILLYIVLTVFLGIWTKNKGEDSLEDYYLAGRSVSWIHLGLTVLATWFSTFTFLGAPGFFYTQGVKWYAVYAFYTFGGVVLFWFFSRKIWILGRNKDYITPGDLLSDFYKSQAIRYIVALISILAIIPYALIQLVGIGKAISGATNGFVSYELVILCTGVVTAFYVYAGGVRAILWTDVFQAVLFFAVIIISCVVAVSVSGGFIEGFSKALVNKPEAFLFKEGDTLSVISTSLTWTLGFITLPHLWQRAYMAKSANNLTKSSLMVAVIAFFLITALMITGIFGMGFISDVKDSDQFIANMFKAHFKYALPLFVLAAFASGMSTVDSQLLTASSVFVRDLIKPFKKDLSDKTEKKLGQIFLFLLIIVLVFLALMPDAQGPIISLATKGTGLAVMLFIPLLGPTYFPNANKYAAFFGLFVSGVYYILAETGVLTFVFGLTPLLAGLILNLLIFLMLNFSLLR